MSNPIRSYSEWNKALWNYFFPTKTENPIFNFNESVLGEIAFKNNIRKASDETSWEMDFLSKALMTENGILCFIENSDLWLLSIDRRAVRWDNLVRQLLEQKLEGIPAYFGALCGIMYIACSIGRDATHQQLKEAAGNYLGKTYSGQFGELVDPLFRKLHDDVNSFDADLMICGLKLTQINMSRMKFHSVLTSEDRLDFIDFLEVNNLKWEYESYSDYITYRLIPALNRAGKSDMVQIVLNPNYIPYVKNILQGGLEYGRTVSRYGNAKEDVDIKWKYEMYLDYYGNPTFYVSMNSWVPLSVRFDKGEFIYDPSAISTDNIIGVSPLHNYSSSELVHEGVKYIISNISESDDEIIFRQITPDSYFQTTEMLEGYSYVKFIRMGVNAKRLQTLTNGWERIGGSMTVEGYDSYMCESYHSRTPGARRNDDRVFNDVFSLNGIGTWYSILLGDGQKLYWKPDKFGMKDPYIEVPTICRSNNRHYFKLDRTSKTQISGKLFVSTTKPDVYAPVGGILEDFHWNGKNQKYYINEWGLITDKPAEDKISCSPPTRRQILNTLSSKSDDDSSMLLQILYDLADDSGCVSQRKMVAAINFVMEYHGLEPNKKNTKNIIYALSRLGYIFSYYNNQRREYENQLCPPYLAKSNYSIDGNRQAYFVKGVYSDTDKHDLLKSSNLVRYKRPYDEENAIAFCPEYICLPDITMVQISGDAGWRRQEYTTAEMFVNLMADMSGFSEFFSINAGGDIALVQNGYNTPCMVNMYQKEEVLCTRGHDGLERLHRRFVNDDYIVPMPKHLARVFCQNAHKEPLCIFDKTPNGKINYGKLTFCEGMGRPYVLDLALCDLNLGLNTVENVFIVDNNASQTVKRSKRAYSYSTCATDSDHEVLLSAIAKIAGRGIDVVEDDPQIYCSVNNRQIHYTMTRCATKDRVYRKLYYRDELVAVATGESSVYLKRNEKNVYYKLNGNDVDQLLSDIICNRSVLFDSSSSSIAEPVEGIKSVQNIRIIQHC